MMMANYSPWSWSDDKIFENALVEFPEGVENRWQKIADCLPGKSPEGVRVHYMTLLYDVGQIESGLIQLPSYSDHDYGNVEQVGSSSGCRTSFPSCRSRPSAFQRKERKKSRPWTKEEHRLFLIGLQRYGKSDWRSISRNLVVTRLPQQVASHAQKYFKRLNTAKESRKRSSIHDLTITDPDCLLVPAPTNHPVPPGFGNSEDLNRLMSW
ncbi:UNVERIFIED_CONTAM: Transcription factor SRM1 [Sesamum radiatum]|uniref:Transcription factor SRM1 n=1 Tax=Sesamum radiatum TaxID=300843 RepID=A0AAW2JWU6_SESRA